MKKISVLFIVICFVNISLLTAQTNRGRVLLGVSSAISFSGLGPNILSLGYSTTTQKSNASGYIEPDPDKTISVNFLPRFGFFIFNNFAIGADVCIGYHQQKSGASNEEYDYTILGAGPFIRFYIPTKKIRPFLESNAVFGSQDDKYIPSSGSGTEDTKSGITIFGAGIGLAAPIGEKATFDIMAGYNSSTTKAKANNPNNDRSVVGNFSVKFGFTIYLGKESL